MSETIASHLASILRCPSCKGNLSVQDHQVICQGCGSQFSIKDGKIFIQNVPSDIIPSTSPTAPETWGGWRKANFSYLEEHIKPLATPESVVPDVGCGPSQFYEALRPYHLVSCDIY